MRDRRPDRRSSGRPRNTTSPSAESSRGAAATAGATGPSSALSKALGRLQDAATAHDGELPPARLPQVKPS